MIIICDKKIRVKKGEKKRERGNRRSFPSHKTDKEINKIRDGRPPPSHTHHSPYKREVNQTNTLT